ncbi:hypothetical protein KFK09_018264 [Dendrobium nobile]|uniref:Uncharacterized protein n=1 Tax=Dendrobium nobile TaxID=94219 RepID=A0A8T3ATX9_DENNO|nr:hypothetical protein KFK09_018264 [Dendrobium nobile]
MNLCFPHCVGGAIRAAFSFPYSFPAIYLLVLLFPLITGILWSCMHRVPMSVVNAEDVSLREAAEVFNRFRLL